MTVIRRDDRHRSLERGISIVEVLVACGVIALLLSISLPAVERIREAARKLQCQDRLRGLMTATQAHIAIQGALPETRAHAVEQPSGRPLPSVSIHTSLLPLLDYQALSQQLDPNESLRFNWWHGPPSSNHPGNQAALEQTIPAFLCPSDVSRPGATNYRTCLGPGVMLRRANTSARGPCIDALGGLGPFVHRRAVALSEFRDGMSNTAFWSERVLGSYSTGPVDPWRDEWEFRSMPSCDTDGLVQFCRSPNAPATAIGIWHGATWLVGGWKSTWYNHAETPNPRHSDCTRAVQGVSAPAGTYSARSYHTGGVHVAFGDGATKFVCEQIDLRVWRAWSTRGSHDDPGPP